MAGLPMEQNFLRWLYAAGCGGGILAAEHDGEDELLEQVGIDIGAADGCESTREAAGSGGSRFSLECEDAEKRRNGCDLY